MHAALSLLAGLAALGPQEAAAPTWPAEEESAATNLSQLSEGFREDLSGAAWNPHTRSLWLCRNGPGADSRVWRLSEGADGALVLADMWGSEEHALGDLEGLTFVDLREPVVFVIDEDDERIRELDVSTAGEIAVLRDYDLSAWLPRADTDGAEALTFVPDEFLARAGFVDFLGLPRVSRLGLGGLMLVGHQNGGGVFAFDLDRATGDVDFVGEYRVAPELASEPLGVTAVAGLEFDRSTGELLVWHQLRERNVLAVVDLASSAVPGEFYRALAQPRLYPGPSGRNYEGVAVASIAECRLGSRRLFLTVDDGKRRALLVYEQFALGCGTGAEPSDSEPAARADIVGSPPGPPAGE